MDDQQRKLLGTAAEDGALAHLRHAGLRLLIRNYRCRVGEIDLVMLDGNTLALIEVRYRATADFGSAAASVTPRKQRRLILAAKHLLMTRSSLQRYAARFDVVAVAPGPAGRQNIEWIRSAFTL